MGGTRFIGKPLVSILRKEGHQLTLFTRGRSPIPEGIEHLKGDRKITEDLKTLSGRKFDAIIDTSGRTLEDTKSVISQTGLPDNRLIYISSAGVYEKSEVLPVDENSKIDLESRHIGKSITENWLINNKIPFTSFRPTYIYGPGNYNPIEKWFFDRIIYKQPIPLPGDGQTITQLGHVYDLAMAIVLSLKSDIAKNKIYNCSATKAITFKGLISQAAIAANVSPEDVQMRTFDKSKLNTKARKGFPVRLENFFTDTKSLQNDLNWSEKYDLLSGLKDSYENDYLKNKSTNPDFSSDQKLLYI